MKPPRWMKVGARVVARCGTMEYEPLHPGLVRRVLGVVPDSPRYGSGWCAEADGGEECVECGRVAGSPTGLIDGAWFQRAPRARRQQARRPKGGDARPNSKPEEVVDDFWHSTRKAKTRKAKDGDA